MTNSKIVKHIAKSTFEIIQVSLLSFGIQLFVVACSWILFERTKEEIFSYLDDNEDLMRL